MKNNVSIFSLFVLFFFTHQGYAEIKNKKALINVFQGFVDEELPDESAGTQFDYCGCFIKEISQGMDFEELMTLGIDVMSARENKKKQEKILISNQKIKNYIVKCASKLYE